jgi:hypothetical protein
MAVQFENVTLIPAALWTTRQMNYDEFLARKKRKAVTDDAVSWANKFPLPAMQEKDIFLEKAYYINIIC